MKYFIVCFLLMFGVKVIAQERLAKTPIPSLSQLHYTENPQNIRPSFISLNLPTNLKLYSVASADGIFHKTYLVNSAGETVNSGFMSFSHFRPSNNLFVQAGPPDKIRDSLNPYGGINLQSMLIVAGLNKLVGKLDINHR